jgi:hypothetical protein
VLLYVKGVIALSSNKISVYENPLGDIKNDMTYYYKIAALMPTCKICGSGAKDYICAKTLLDDKNTFYVALCESCFKLIYK